MAEDKKKYTSVDKNDSEGGFRVALAIAAGVGAISGFVVGYVINGLLTESSETAYKEPQKQHSSTCEFLPSDYQSGRCSVCLVNEARVLFLPCRHVATCDSCFRRMGQTQYHCCPLCNKNYEETMNVYVN